MFIATVLGNLTPYVSKLLIDAVPSLNYYLLLKLVFVFITLKIISNLLNALSKYLGDRALLPAARDARIQVFKKVQDLDFAFHVDKSTGKLISIFKR